MNKKGFANFVSSLNDFPYSNLTVRDVQAIIESYPNDTMPFKITDTFSWRGIYNHPAVSISTEEATKEENLKELNDIVTKSYTAWKGGEYRYDEMDLLHFEVDPGDSHTGEYSFILKFIYENKDNEFVKHLVNAIETGSYVYEDVHYDLTGHALYKNAIVLFSNDDNELTYGKITALNKYTATVEYQDFRIDQIKYENLILTDYVIFKRNR